MPPHWFIIIVALFAAHCVADAFGVQLGTQLRLLFKPVVWLIYGVTLGRINLGKCAACHDREKYLNNLLNPKK